MTLFNFGKKEEETICACSKLAKETEKECCCCKVDSSMTIKVLGSGCKSCHHLLENTKEAVQNLGLHFEVEYVTDLEKVMEYGVMSMPALVVNEQVVSAGKVLKSADIEKLLHTLGC